jgi:hypothetical protein
MNILMIGSIIMMALGVFLMIGRTFLPGTVVIILGIIISLYSQYHPLINKMRTNTDLSKVRTNTDLSKVRTNTDLPKVRTNTDLSKVRTNTDLSKVRTNTDLSKVRTNTDLPKVCMCSICNHKKSKLCIDSRCHCCIIIKEDIVVGHHNSPLQ